MAAGAIAAGTIISGLMAKKSAQASARASEAGVREQRRQFDLTREDTAPYRYIGGNALNQLAQLYGIEPYQGQLDEGADDRTVKVQFGDDPKEYGSLEEYQQAKLRERARDYDTGSSEGQEYKRQILRRAAAQWYAAKEAAAEVVDQQEDEEGRDSDLQTEFDLPFDSPYEKFELGEFEASPGYQFRVEQGEQGTKNYLGANRMRLSGAGMKEMERFRQGLASDEFNNFFNRQVQTHQQRQRDRENYISRLLNLTGLGQGGVNTAVQAGGQTTNAITNLMGQRGQAQAQGYAGMNNAIQGGLSNWVGYQQQQNMMNNYRNAQYRQNPVQGDAYMPAYGGYQ